jgi:NAD(P)-dependent dehydrogenase (short-subunit alcohol dehydrogenase family)
MNTHGFDTQLFAGRQVVVVGGSSGIGRAVAQAFAAHGAAVLASGASAEHLEAAAAEPQPAFSGSLRFVALDVRDAAAVRSFFEALAALDVLVNCAGVVRRGDEHDPEVFDAVLDVNLSGTMRCCSAARELLARSAGCIVNTASMLSFFGGALVPAYAASKGGVAQLTKSLALAYAAQGIRVNAVAPGWIATPLTAALQQDAARSAAILGRTPLGRWGEPGDIAGPVLFLASPAARFVTGVVLPVDGGYLVA